MIQYYAPEIETTSKFPPEESAHCVRVLRKHEGDEVIATDGAGSRFKGVITRADAKGMEVAVSDKEEIGRDYPYRLVIAVAPTKNADRIEWLVEKGIEMGVDEIVLLNCKRSERKKMSTSRLERIAVSAMNQSLKVNLPRITEMTDLKQFLKRDDLPAQRYFGYCSPELERKDFAAVYQRGADVVIMIGPEGDFSEEEVAEAVKHGFTAVTFGNFRLRTETAALYGIQSVHLLNSL